MDEEFESFVVTDPDIVDPGIDVSGLRTQTDVSPYLLGNIPDYPGIQYEAFNPNRLSDLMRLYSSGLPAIDTSTAAPPATGGGGSGDGGQATTPTDDFNKQEFEKNLVDQGVGLQIAPGDPVVAPGEIPVTQEEIDAFNQIPVNREFGAPMNIGFGEGQVDPKLAAAVGGKDTTPVGGGNLVTTASGDVFAADDPMLQEKIDFTPEQQGTIQNILGNTPGCVYTGNSINPIQAGSRTIGSVSDERNDSLYWLVAGSGNIQSILPLPNDQTATLKDMIMRTNPEVLSGCEPVFVDKYGFCIGINDPSTQTNSITFNDSNLYSNITNGMTVNGYNGVTSTFGPTLVLSLIHISEPTRPY